MKTLEDIKLLFEITEDGWHFYGMLHADPYTAMDRATNSITSDCQALIAQDFLYIATKGGCTDPDAQEILV